MWWKKVDVTLKKVIVTDEFIERLEEAIRKLVEESPYDEDVTGSVLEERALLYLMCTWYEAWMNVRRCKNGRLPCTRESEGDSWNYHIQGEEVMDGCIESRDRRQTTDSSVQVDQPQWSVEATSEVRCEP